jgi:hypothetical protein
MLQGTCFILLQTFPAADDTRVRRPAAIATKRRLFAIARYVLIAFPSTGTAPLFQDKGDILRYIDASFPWSCYKDFVNGRIADDPHYYPSDCPASIKTFSFMLNAFNRQAFDFVPGYTSK